MSTISEARKGLVEKHAASGEKVQEVSDTDRLIAVTDRRIITIEEGVKDNRDQRIVESQLFTGPDISGVTVEELAGKQYDTATIALGALMAVVGVAIALILGEIGIIGGILVGGIGLSLLLSGFLRAEDQDIAVTLHRQNGDDTVIQLSDSEANIATAVSEAVASTHGAT